MKTYLGCFVRQYLKLLKILLSISLLTLIYSCKPGSGDGLDTNGQPIVSTPPPAADDLFAQAQAVFDARCIVCHAGALAPRGLQLTADQSYAQLVNQPSTQQPNVMLVVPGAADASYLIQKVRGDSGISGNQMPRNGPPFLSDPQTQTLIDWVAAGAPPPVPVDPNAEFMAKLADFANYSAWDPVDYSIGDTNVALSGAHKGNDFDWSRRVFANPAALNSSGSRYDNGSILVKEVTSYKNGSKEFADTTGLLAMVKRGGDFNPDHNGWDWFLLAPDLSEISAQGANLMDGGCNSCHVQGALDTSDGFGGMDYVFKHPSEWVASAADFTDYLNWTLIDDRSDANPLLDGMAHGDGLENTRRKVYKKQLYANPDTINQGYPVGTTLVKEVSQDGNVIEITAMVKRGDDFNSDHHGWEWFMLDPATMDFVLDQNNQPARGANLMEGMCNGCHMAANPTSGHGTDYVFKHDGDPFNNSQQFFAQLSDFGDYLQWPIVNYTIADVSGVLGGGHQGPDPAYSRIVYANPAAVNLEGTVFQKGSIFVKEIVSWQSGSKAFSPVMGLLAMAKRGDGFNPDFGGWEWFELANDTSDIIGRGGDYRNNGCNGCHQLAMDNDLGLDFAFDHPSELVADNDNFSHYQDWLKIDERNDNNPLLGGMAHGGGDPSITRKVYKKQAYAKHLAEATGYPIGTTIVKELIQDDQIIEITAMVKRGGQFNSEHSFWEWFMLNPADATIMLDENGAPKRGDDLMGDMCNSCHNQANETAGTGLDYIFNHADDPLPNLTTNHPNGGQ